MINFLAQIRALDEHTPQPAQSQLEPRSVRRQKARDAAKPARDIGAAASSSDTMFCNSLESEEENR